MLIVRSIVFASVGCAKKSGMSAFVLVVFFIPTTWVRPVLVSCCNLGYFRRNAVSTNTFFQIRVPQALSSLGMNTSRNGAQNVQLWFRTAKSFPNSSGSFRVKFVWDGSSRNLFCHV